ncbi:hypothetical protein CMV_026126 [Castanea mollissima]|uniref:AAA+ ATPase domain-containing protein n=1 Tax=Castanea mollissima TaxID=60419 RepID=A0A8J4QDQ5_9ROSI|nr:hypothetical protein CMV_026126 [Castanea mollissima]
MSQQIWFSSDLIWDGILRGCVFFKKSKGLCDTIPNYTSSLPVNYFKLPASQVETFPAWKRCVGSKIKTTVNLKSNIAAVEKEMKSLMDRIKEVKHEKEANEKEGNEIRAQVVTWLEDVEKLQLRVNPIQGKKPSACFLNCSKRYRESNEVEGILEEIKRLLEVGNFESGMAYPTRIPRTVEHIPGPSIQGQTTASKALEKTMRLLSDDRFQRIGIWGLGGVGKTTMVRTLNNELQSTSRNIFGIIIWVTVSKNSDMKQVQAQIALRLNLEMKMEESVERMAIRLHQRLMNEEKYLLILDDVWQKLDLDSLGVPQPDVHKGSKIILTTRFMEVCRKMMTDVEVKVDDLNDEEAWQLFSQKAGDVAHLEGIKPFAEAIARECCGLPLAIIIVGAAMRRKTKVELWEDALKELQRSVPSVEGIEDEVYKPLKWSYDSLQGNNTKSCFLYCSLFPEDFSIEVSELVLHWRAKEVSTLLLQGSCPFEEVPERFLLGFETLKVLNLSRTNIRSLPDSILQLEVLDVTNSSYQFLVKGKEEGETTFEELIRLDGLLVLSIKLKSIPWLSSDDLSWINRLRRFQILIGPTAYSFLTTHDKSVAISKIDSTQDSILQLWDISNSLVLKNCSNLNLMLDDLVINTVVGFIGLKSLTIERCTITKSCPVRGLAACCDLLPNLEELTLGHLNGIKSISELFGQLGLRFLKLKSIEVRDSSEMKYLLSCGDIIQTLPNLEVIKVSFCWVLEELFNYDSGQNMAPDPVVPKLRTLQLEDLSSLRTLGRHEEIWPCLEEVTVFQCNCLRRLPLTIQNTGTIKEIKGESEWWDALQWDDDKTKISLLPHFHPALH